MEKEQGLLVWFLVLVGFGVAPESIRRLLTFLGSFDTWGFYMAVLEERVVLGVKQALSRASQSALTLSCLSAQGQS